MKKRILRIKFTKGFGNNLFQYCFCRLLSEKQGFELSHNAILEMNIPKVCHPIRNGLGLKYIKDIKKLNPNGLLDYHKILNTKLKNSNYEVLGYFEDYTIYKPYLEKIRSWFPSVPITNKEDIVLHIRLGDKLLCANNYKDFIPPDMYRDILNKLEFNNLYIVTDTLKWGGVTEDDIKQIRKNEAIKRRKLNTPMVTYPYLKESKASGYCNKLADCLSEFNPIVKSGNLLEDFNFIRSFNKMIIGNSTFSWWAATLSGAGQIGIYKYWRPNKGNRNKNLGRTDYPGWFSWGREK